MQVSNYYKSHLKEWGLDKIAAAAASSSSATTGAIARAVSSRATSPVSVNSAPVSASWKYEFPAMSGEESLDVEDIYGAGGVLMYDSDMEAPSTVESSRKHYAVKATASTPTTPAAGAAASTSTPNSTSNPNSNSKPSSSSSQPNTATTATATASFNPGAVINKQQTPYMNFISPAAFPRHGVVSPRGGVFYAPRPMLRIGFNHPSMAAHPHPQHPHPQHPHPSHPHSNAHLPQQQQHRTASSPPSTSGTSTHR